jgi:hypothetical protein
MNGLGSKIYSNGDKFLGEFKDGLRSGIGEDIWSDGTKFVG